MPQRSEAESLALRLWRQLYQTYTLLKRAEDEAAESFGLTTEQYAVLVTLDYFGGTMKVSDIAAWLERTPNSMSMIVDRMLKVGLITRKRDRIDRRLVHVTITAKGKAFLKPAAGAMLELILKVLSSLSADDRTSLFDLLEAIKVEIIRRLNPGVDIVEVKRKELERTGFSRAWLDKYGLPSALQATRKAGKEKVRRLRNSKLPSLD
jgi:DNA-binding MarR family transcriptional regulator